MEAARDPDLTSAGGRAALALLPVRCVEALLLGDPAWPSSGHDIPHMQGTLCGFSS